jgi:hypothetical protein
MAEFVRVMEDLGLQIIEESDSHMEPADAVPPKRMTAE